jgi:hypothetical protein
MQLVYARITTSSAQQRINYPKPARTPTTKRPSPISSIRFAPVNLASQSQSESQMLEREIRLPREQLVRDSLDLTVSDVVNTRGSGINATLCCTIKHHLRCVGRTESGDNEYNIHTNFNVRVGATSDGMVTQASAVVLAAAGAVALFGLL